MATESATIKINQANQNGGINATFGLWFTQPNPSSPYGGASGIFNGDLWWSFFRFPVPARIPANATIISAYLSLRVYDPQNVMHNGPNDHLMIWLQDQDDPLLPTTVNNKPGGTTAVTTYPAFPADGIRWPATGDLTATVWAVGARLNSPNLATLIQHRLTVYGTMEQGDIISLWLAQKSVGGNLYGLYSYYTAPNGDIERSPWLHITWETPDPPPAPVVDDISILTFNLLRS